MGLGHSMEIYFTSLLLKIVTITAIMHLILIISIK